MSRNPSAGAQQVIAQVQQMNLVSTQMTQAAAGRIGINTLDLHVVQVLRTTQGPTTASDLARLTGISTAAATGLVDRLELAGYVRRVPDATDRRRTIIELSGKRVGADLGPVFAPLLQRWTAVLSDYTEAQLALVSEVLSALVASIDEEAAALRQG